MKTTNYFRWRTVYACIAVMLFSCLFITSCDDDDDGNPVDNQPYTISGNASGSQMVPEVTGTGSATITGTYNPATRELNYTSNYSELTGQPNAGGFYIGASGSSGLAVGTPFSITGGTGTGTTTGKFTLTTEQADQLLGGNWYYSYGTAAYPSGEVRGQITTTR